MRVVVPPRFAAIFLLLLGAPAGAPAQSTRDVDLNVLAMVWARGSFVSPMVCQVDGHPVRALRHVQIVPTGPDVAQRGMRVQFPDPEARGATRCFSELGGDAPEIAGNLVIGRSGRGRPDTAQHDFQSALSREGGFDFEIRSGRLKIKGWEPDAAAREVSFEKGSARLRQVRVGEDAARVLAGLPGDRALTLELEAPDGTKIFLPMVQIPAR